MEGKRGDFSYQCKGFFLAGKYSSYFQASRTYVFTYRYRRHDLPWRGSKCDVLSMGEKTWRILLNDIQCTHEEGRIRRVEGKREDKGWKRRGAGG